MGEIKSTLDIIMEKTKGLTMSEEEKEAFQKKETEGKVRGFLQKYIDGLMDMDRLKAELAALGKPKQVAARAFLRTECMARIELGAENSRILYLLQEVLGFEAASISKLLSESDDEVSEKKRKREKQLLKRLKKRGISGSAVIPNIEADAEWGQYMATAKEEFQAKLRKLT